MVELDEKQKKEFGERVRSIRIELGVNQEKFGEYFKKNDDPNDKEGIANKAVVSAWERGVSVPTIDRLKIIAELGNMTVNELLYGSDYYIDLIDYINNYCKLNSIDFNEEIAKPIAKKYSSITYKKHTDGSETEIGKPPQDISEIPMERLISDYLFYTNTFTNEELQLMKDITYDELLSKGNENLSEIETSLFSKLMFERTKNDEIRKSTPYEIENF